MIPFRGVNRLALGLGFCMGYAYWHCALAPGTVHVFASGKGLQVWTLCG
jgi:hypothetical protein